jgi:hypothetical protein
VTEAGKNEQPIFALDASADWDDVVNAMTASVQYQTKTRGRFGPMFAFAPMTEPGNLDEWEPLQVPPKFLLVASIERNEDDRLLKAFTRAQAEIGPLLLDSPASPVQIQRDRLVADVYGQMEQAGVTAYCSIGEHEDDPSYFFLRGTDAILAVNEHLRALSDG